MICDARLSTHREKNNWKQQKVGKEIFIFTPRIICKTTTTWRRKQKESDHKRWWCTVLRTDPTTATQEQWKQRVKHSSLI